MSSSSRFSHRVNQVLSSLLVVARFSKLLNYELPSIFVLFFFFFFYSIVLFNNSIENPPGGGIGMLHAGHGYEYEFGPLSRAWRHHVSSGVELAAVAHDVPASRHQREHVYRQRIAVLHGGRVFARRDAYKIVALPLLNLISRAKNESLDVNRARVFGFYLSQFFVVLRSRFRRRVDIPPRRRFLLSIRAI